MSTLGLTAMMVQKLADQHPGRVDVVEGCAEDWRPPEGWRRVGTFEAGSLGFVAVCEGHLRKGRLVLISLMRTGAMCVFARRPSVESASWTNSRPASWSHQRSGSRPAASRPPRSAASGASRGPESQASSRVERRRARSKLTDALKASRPARPERRRPAPQDEDDTGTVDPISARPPGGGGTLCVHMRNLKLVRQVDESWNSEQVEEAHAESDQITGSLHHSMVLWSAIWVDIPVFAYAVEGGQQTETAERLAYLLFGSPNARSVQEAVARVVFEFPTDAEEAPRGWVEPLQGTAQDMEIVPASPAEAHKDLMGDLSREVDAALQQMEVVHEPGAQKGPMPSKGPAAASQTKAAAAAAPQPPRQNPRALTSAEPTKKVPLWVKHGRLIGLFALFLSAAGLWAWLDSNKRADRVDRFNRLVESRRAEQRRAHASAASAGSDLPASNAPRLIAVPDGFDPILELLDPPIMHGGADAASVDYAVLDTMVGVENCFRATLVKYPERGPALAGTFTIKLFLDSNGAVSRLDLSQRQIDLPDGDECLTAALSGMAAPEGGGAGGTAVAYTFGFRPWKEGPPVVAPSSP